MRPQRESSWRRTANVTFGLLSLLAGAFFFNGLVIHLTRETIQEAGNIWPLELVGPFIALGVALFILTLVLTVLPR